ncbi:hypothetical protein MKW94_012310, partial [Papaver nudicaule]|nr:hypothetical protein [Papaver nudicaule]
MASSSGNENNKQNTVDSDKADDVTVFPKTFGGILEYLKGRRNFVEPPYYGWNDRKKDPVLRIDDPKVECNVLGGERKRALEMLTGDEIEESPVKKKSRPRADDMMWDHDHIIRTGQAWTAHLNAIA